MSWQEMDSAPMDGTVIEIKNDYGRGAWTGLYMWRGEPERDPDWGSVGYTLGWQNVEDGMWIDDGANITWRLPRRIPKNVPHPVTQKTRTWWKFWA